MTKKQSRARLIEFKPKTIKLGGLIPLTYDASIELAPGIVFYHEVQNQMLSISNRESWYWGTNEICVHITNYGKKSKDKHDNWYGWIVTSTCGIEPPHHKTRAAAFKAAIPYVHKTIKKQLTKLTNDLNEAIQDFSAIHPELNNLKVSLVAKNQFLV